MRLLPLFLFAVFLIGCSDNSGFPEVKHLSNYKQTSFALTLEHPIPPGKNVIYAPSFLYAWDEIKKELQIATGEPDSVVDIQLLNASTSFQHALDDVDYTVDKSIGNNIIQVSSYFKKSLPFKFPFERLDSTFYFKGKGVSAFTYNRQTKNQIHVLYYKNDSSFVIRLVPKNREHSIILSMGIDLSGTLINAINQTDSLIAIGKHDDEVDSLRWKGRLEIYDEVVVPIIKFNIETDYTSMVGHYIKDYQIVKAHQRTAFILDEYGAVVESDADMVTAADANRVPTKHIFFNKPFLIMLKSKSAQYPYFVMKVDNAELMEPMKY